MGGGKVCKVGHAYASYLDACPYCETKSAVTPSQNGDTVTGLHCPSCTCVDRKTHGTNALRQRAYRKRKRADA